MSSLQAQAHTQQRHAFKENPGQPVGKDAVKGAPKQRRFGEDLTNTQGANGALRGPLKQKAPEARKAEVKAATSAASKRASKKPIVPEMEYAYYDEVKPHYKDPIVEGMDFRALLRATPMVEERPLPPSDEIPPEFAIHAGDIASLLIDDDIPTVETDYDFQFALAASLNLEPISFDEADSY